MIKKLRILGILLIGLVSCDDDKNLDISSDTLALLERSKNSQNKASSVLENIQQRNDFGSAQQSRQEFLDQIENDEFVDIEKLSTYFKVEMPYASSNNFLNEKVYDCKKCLLRGEVAKALLEVQKNLMKKGYRIKIFDCYRPLTIQKKMWELNPDPKYVANPEEGSIHNRGAAVDLTLTNLQGKVLDMGTNFDDFSEKAHHDYNGLSTKILNNRKFLKSAMESSSFSSFETEWWHYNYNQGNNYEIADFIWECE